MPDLVPVPASVRGEVWAAAEEAIRGYFEAEGLRQVGTPVVVEAPAVEPYIQPVRDGSGWIRTSPELAMKRLLCAGSGAIFEIGPVAREGERGVLHRERFHLVEWYRLGNDTQNPYAPVGFADFQAVDE